MIRLLGPTPLQFLVKADKGICSMFFSDEGMLYWCNTSDKMLDGSEIFRFPHLIPSEEYNFSNLTPFLQCEDKRLFLEFAKRMIHWDPEHRATAGELYDDHCWVC